MALTREDFEEAQNIIEQFEVATKNSSKYQSTPLRKPGRDECIRMNYLWENANEEQKSKLKALEHLIYKNC